MALLVRSAGVLLLAVAYGLFVGPFAAEANECEVSWLSNTTYSVAQGDQAVEVEARVLPDLEDWDSGCGDPVLSFPVVPGVSGIEVDSPAAYSLEIRRSGTSEKSASALLIFSAEDIDVLSGGLSTSYTMVADGDWVVVDDWSGRFPVWSVGERQGSIVTVESSGYDVIVVSTSAAFGQSGVGSASYTLSGEQEWDAYTSITFGSYEQQILAEDIRYFVDRDGSDPDVTVIEGAADGFLAMGQLFGPRPTLGKPIDLIEVDEGMLGGYAGQHEELFELIQVDATVQQGTLLHEIGHAWLNGSTFADTWMSEGLADYVSMLAEEQLPGTDSISPVRPEWTAPSGPPLRGWDAGDLDSDAAAMRVEYGYAASFWVVDRIAAEVGSIELMQYAGSLVAERANGGTPVTSEEFLIGLEKEFGFTDREDVYRDFVLGSVAAMESARARDLPPVAASGPAGLSPVSSLGFAAAAAVAVLMTLYVLRSLRNRPLGRTVRASSGPAGDDGDVDAEAEDDLVDSAWSF